MLRIQGACFLPLAFALVLAAGLAGRAEGTEIVSKGAPPPAGHTSGVPTVAPISADGRFIAFVSLASNILSGQTDGSETPDVFLYDAEAKTTVLVSHAPGSATTTVNAASSGPVISADGGYVAFFSNSAGLVSGQSDANATYDLFLYNRQDGTVTLVSHASGSALTAGNGASSGPSIDSTALSADGRYVAFESFASNLVAGQVDFNSAPDIFLYDRTAGTSVLVSRAGGSTAVTGNGASREPRISGDGRYVVFRSAATNLVSGQTDANGGDDVFLFDRDTGTVTLVSHAHGAAAAAGDGASQAPRISGDGGYLAFASLATNLVSGQADSAASSDVFLYERASGTLTLVSRSAGSAATAGNGASSAPDLSSDGAYVAFASSATDLAAGQTDANADLDVFLYDRASGTTTLASRAASSSTTAGQSWSREPRISPDGGRIAFRSNAGNLVPGQTGPSGGFGNIFFWDRRTGLVGLASGSLASSTNTGDRDSYSQSLDADGSRIVFSSTSPNLVAGDTNGVEDVFLYTAIGPADFYTVTPCRLLDTRLSGPYASGVSATVTVHGHCGIPATATSVSLNVTAVGATGPGHLVLFPGDLPQPPVSAIHVFSAGRTRANNAILLLATDGSGTLKIHPFVEVSGTVHVVLDVNGYFEP